MNERLFHGACAVILALSIGLAILRPAPPAAQGDPYAQLLRFLAASGLETVSDRPVVAQERLIEVRRGDCNAPLYVLFLPSIHRISDISAAMTSERNDVHYIHAGESIGTMSGWSLIPRWLSRRLLVNFQLKNEDPWISILIITMGTDECKFPALDWNLLHSS